MDGVTCVDGDTIWLVCSNWLSLGVIVSAKASNSPSLTFSETTGTVDELNVTVKLIDGLRSAVAINAGALMAAEFEALIDGRVGETNGCGVRVRKTFPSGNQVSTGD